MEDLTNNSANFLMERGVDRPIQVAVWFRGNAPVFIDVIAIRRPRSVLGWVTVYGRINYLVMFCPPRSTHPPVIHLWIDAKSTTES